MKKLIMLWLFLIFYPLGSYAAFIDFDDGTKDATVGNFYSAQGVTFSNAVWVDNFGLAGVSGKLGIAANNTSYQWFSDNPLIAYFTSAVTQVSFRGVDVGDNGLRINAYDALTGGNLVSSDEAFGTGLGNNEFFTLLTQSAMIKRIEIFQVRNISIDGTFIENFQFSNNVPEPSALFLLSFGFWCLIRLKQTNKVHW